MRFGFHFMDFTMPGGSAALAPAVAETARAADEIGASWFTVMDHWFQMEAFRTAHDPMLEATPPSRSPRHRPAGCSWAPSSPG